MARRDHEAVQAAGALCRGDTHPRPSRHAASGPGSPQTDPQSAHPRDGMVCGDFSRVI